MNITILKFDTIDSTNSEALKQARRGADEGLCLVAKEQTAGRGRQGRVWISERDAGLYFTILLRPQLEPKFLPLITLMAGVAVHDTLEEIGIDADIKWVNDLLVNDKKVGGILAETGETANGLAVVVGIGINLKPTNFPPEIAETSTSLEAELSSAVEADELTQLLVKQLTHFYSTLTSVNGPATIIAAWQQRSSYFAGKSVRVTLENEIFEGVTDGLEENGALRVALADGSVKIVQAGDVQRLRTE